MKRLFFPVWCKGSIGDSRSPDAGSSPAAGSIDPHGHARHTPRIAVLTATLGLLTASLAFTGTTALAEPLPDGRVYEKVTPSENYDADVYVPLVLPSEFVNNEGEFSTKLPFQVAAGGEAVAYVAAPTVDGTGHSGLGQGDEYLARWSAGGGWAGPVNLQPLGERGAVVNSAFYQAFSPDLTRGILQAGYYGAPGGPVLSSQAPGEGYMVLYSHELEGGAFQPFATETPTNRDPTEFRTFDIPKTSKNVKGQLAFAGGSSNGERLFFEANGAFAGTGAAGGSVEDNNLYESVGGGLSLVNRLPDGSTEANATFGAEAFEERGEEPGINPPDFSGVVSEDGSRVYWTDLASGPDQNHIYVRVDSSRTLPVSAGAARYWTSADDGLYAFYVENGQLLRFDAESEEREPLTVAGAGVQGVLGEGETGGQFTIYFVARGVLGEGNESNGVKAEPGHENLYVLKEGSPPTFIAQLSGEDGSETIDALHRLIGETGDWQPGLGHRTAEVTPDGGSLVFMSNNQKVDGRFEEASGRPLEEVYVYDAASGGLWCASCGRSRGFPAVETRESEHGLGGFLPISLQLTYQPTVISEDGSKVFFDSPEPLVAGDTNSELDVYEWERDGSGGCKESAGCVYLLSGGDASTSSFLVGGDASGENVFFVTRAQLVPQDENENYDLYDARVNGIQPVLPSACTGTGCQGVPASAPTFATPSSVTFEGVGNFAAPAVTTGTKPNVKTKPPTNAQKLTKALRACGKEARGKRAACRARAIRRYGTKPRRK